MKLKLTLCSLLLSFALLNSAEILIDTAIVVNGTNHELLFSVPENYSDDNAYPLIIGIHYCGGSAMQYRNALKELSDSLNVIIACPGYFSQQVPKVDTNMFQVLADTANSIFNINNQEIYLTGMSCNAEYILREGLKTEFLFKGIFPWAPWVDSSSPDLYNYESELPIVISIGLKDPKLKTTLQIFDSLKNHNAHVNIILVPDVDHTLNFAEFDNTMYKSLDYFNNKSALTIHNIDDFTMLTNSEHEVIFTIDNANNKEYSLQVFSSSPIRLAHPEISQTGNENEYKMVFTPNEFAGEITVVVDLIEDESRAVSQTTFKVTLEKASGIDGSKIFSNIKCYPNPVNNVLYIENIEANNNIAVYDLLGNIVFSTIANGSKIEIPFTLPNGLYLVNISDSNNFKCFKVLKTSN